MIVCDIDGTLTRSDIIGYSAHVLGYEYMHEGVSGAFPILWFEGSLSSTVAGQDVAHLSCLSLNSKPLQVTEALSHLSDCGYNLIFLSARPITASHQTRAFLLQVALPLNPKPQPLNFKP